jgi:hypothetical protein
VALMHALCITRHILVRNRLRSRQSSERGLRESGQDCDLNAVCRHYIGYRMGLRQAEAHEDIIPPRHLEEYLHGSRPIFPTAPKLLSILPLDSGLILLSHLPSFTVLQGKRRLWKCGPSRHRRKQSRV